MARTFDATPFENLRLPTEEEFKEIAKDLALTPEQNAALRHRVSIIIDECDRYYAGPFKRPDKEALREKANTIHRLLKKIENEIKNAQPLVDEIVPLYGSGAMGRLVSFETIATINKARTPTYEAAPDDWKNVDLAIRPTLEKLEAQETRLSEIRGAEVEAITTLQLESHLSQSKMIFDHQNRASLLLHIVGEMKDQFDFWLQEQSAAKDAGGRPFDLVRRHFIDSLACDARHVLGQPVTKSGGGAFLQLCNDVFNACGVETDSLESAIRNHLKVPSVWLKVSEHNSIGY